MLIPVAHLSPVHRRPGEDRRARRSSTAPTRRRGWLPDLEHVRSLITPATRALVVIDPNNPTGATYPRRPGGRSSTSPSSTTSRSSPTRSTATSPTTARWRALAGLYPDAPIISFSSLSKAYLAPGWRTGWMAVGRTARLDDVLAGVKKLADGRLCSTGPMEHATRAGAQRRSIAPAGVPRRAARARRDHDHARSTRSTASRRRADRRVLRDAQGALAAGRTDEDYVLGLLRATGVLCVYGSGFGTAPEDGFFRVVFLASPGGALRHLRPDRRLSPREFLSRAGRTESSTTARPSESH